MANKTRKGSLEDFAHQPQVIKFWPKGVGYDSVKVHFTLDQIIQDDLTYTATLPVKLKKQIGPAHTNQAVRFFDKLRKQIDSAEARKAELEAAAVRLELRHAKKLRDFTIQNIGTLGSEMAEDILESRVIFDKAWDDKVKAMYKKSGLEYPESKDQLIYEELGENAKEVIDEARAAIDGAFEKEHDIPASGNYKVVEHKKHKPPQDEDVDYADAEERRKEFYDFFGKIAAGELEQEESDDEAQWEKWRQEDIEAGYDDEYYAEKERVAQENEHGDEEQDEDEPEDEEADEEEGEDDAEEEDADAEEQDFTAPPKTGNPFSRDSSFGRLNPKTKQTALSRSSGVSPLKTGNPLKRDPAFGAPLKTGNPFQKDPAFGAPPKTGNPFQKDHSFGDLSTPLQTTDFSSDTISRSSKNKNGKFREVEEKPVTRKRLVQVEERPVGRGKRVKVEGKGEGEEFSEEAVGLRSGMGSGSIWTSVQEEVGFDCRVGANGVRV